MSKAAERLEVVDAYMRARVSFLVAGKDRGYFAPEAELDSPASPWTPAAP